MKIIFTLLSALLFTFAGKSQSATAKFQGKIKPGTSANSVIIVVKSNESFTGQWTNVQFVLQVPNTVSQQPTATIKNNPLSTNVPTVSYIPLTSNEGGFYNYLFSATTVASPSYSFVNGTEIDVLEIQFTNGPVSPAHEVRLAQVPNGGTSTQMNFYIEVSGNDNTNTTAMFYGAGSSNNAAGYTAYSYTPLSSVVLPVSWGSMSASCTGNGVKLQWNTYTEINSHRFEIEKALDVSGWKNIGVVMSAGNSSENRRYEFTDLAGGNARYRLKLIDKDGKFSYSPTLIIHCSVKQTELYVYPIPATNILNVVLLTENTGPADIQLIDVTGRIHHRETQHLLAGSNNFKINISGFITGEYYLRIIEKGKMRTEKIIIAAR